MKYKPEPVKEEVKAKTTTGKAIALKGWEVEFEKDSGGYIFDNQDDAMVFCLLLEIRDLLSH